VIANNELSQDAAASQLIAVQSGYAARGMTLGQAALCGARDFVEWAHYPAHDCADSVTGFEFYYHAHNRDEMLPEEHGHFHVFERNASKPDRFFHVIGISLDFRGLPINLFTTNAWVTGETMVSAPKVAKAARQFSVTTRGRMAPIARWVTALIRLYALEIAELAHQRDQKLARLAHSGRSKKEILQDRRVRVLSQRRIHLLRQLNPHCPLQGDLTP
jgi:hypothetical protein